ncbi:MAG: trans-sulfuration enzyme family protein [Bacteroidota bacterium]
MKRKNNQTKKYSTETKLIYGKMATKKWDFNHHVIPPISSSATFRLDTAKRGAQGFAEFAHSTKDETITSRAPIYIYDRLGEPNKELLEENLAIAEEGEIAITYSTGMAAVSAILGSLTGHGDEIIAHPMLYGCTYSLLTNWYPRLQIKTKFIDLMKPENLTHAINPQTRVIYFESPVNPTLDLIDIRTIVNIVKKANERRSKMRKIYVVIDNTFASPYCQRPLSMGADFSVSSLTKSICGFGTDMGGVVVGPKWSYDILMLYRKDFGGTLAAKSAWPILVYGLPSLPVRMRRQMETAHEVASFLENHPAVEFVAYPGLPSFKQSALAKIQMRDYNGNFAPGGIIWFSLKGKNAKAQRDKGEAFINYLAHHAYSITLAVSLGHIRTLVEHPSSMTHSAIPLIEQVAKGLQPGGIRLSIGLETAEDLLLDISCALDHLP